MSVFKPIALDSLYSYASFHFAIKSVTNFLICFPLTQFYCSPQDKSSLGVFVDKSASSIMECLIS